MYIPIIYLLIIMCFTSLIQILPSETDLSTPKSTDLSTPRSTFINNTPRCITIGSASRHVYTSKQLRAIYDHVKPTSLTNLPIGSIRRTIDLRLNKKQEVEETKYANILNM